MQEQLDRMREKRRLQAESEAERRQAVIDAEKRREYDAKKKVQTELPEVAKMLTEMTNIFGKLSRITVKNLETGEVTRIR